MKHIYIKPLKIGQLCTMNGHVYQAKKGHCADCDLCNEAECRDGQIDCLSIIKTNIRFKRIK